MIRSFPSLLCVLTLAVMACGCARCDGAKPSAPSHEPTAEAPRVAAPLPVIEPPKGDLRLVLMTDPLGHLEPCGCQQRPLGGLDKLATIVAEARAQGVPTVVLSAGDFSVGTELRADDAAEARAQEEMRGRTFVEIWERFEPAAIAPGALDLAQPADTLDDLSGLAGFPWLVDNASIAESKTRKKAPVTTSRIVEGAGLKIGLLGLVAPDPLHAAGDGITLTDDLAAIAQKKTDELRVQGAELVIALVSADRRTARAIASKGPDLVLMGGLHLEEPLPPAQVGKAVLLHAGQQGQYAVQLDLGIKGKPDGEWEDASNWSRKAARKEIEKQIKERRDSIASWEKDPKVDPRDLTTQRNRLRDLEDERDIAKAPTFAGRWFYADLIALAPEVPGNRDVGMVIDEHDKRVNEHNKKALAGRLPIPAHSGEPSYAGSESCASCHKEAYAWWQTTKHGHAYKTLQDVHKEYNLSCVGCHVVGYNQPGGSTVTHVDKLENVGCESCHGPGSMHNAAPHKPALIARAVPEKVCGSCHTHEHSDRFSYDAFKALLIVPGHGKPADRQ